MTAPANALLALIAALTFTAGGYWWGASAELNAIEARQTRAAEAATVALLQDVKNGKQAATALQADKASLEDRHAQLDQQHQALRRRVPLTVAKPVVPEAPADLGTAEAAGCITVHLEPQPELTLFAVRLWNSRLAGQDIGAGACRADATDAEAEAACAQGAGLTLDDAIANQADNARSCAEDRLNFDALKHFIRQREASQ